MDRASSQSKSQSQSQSRAQQIFCKQTNADHEEIDDHHVSDDLPAEQISFLSLHLQELPKLGERGVWKSNELWRQEKIARSLRIEKQLKALEDLVDKQLRGFQAQYSRAMMPTLPKDVAQLLIPKSTPPLELATLFWLGDWRPSAILGLLQSSLSLASSLSYAGTTERVISQSIHDLRIEEAILDEEMTEIQANCILHLPFSPVQDLPSGPALAQVQSELKKVHRVIIKAQNLRINTLEFVVKKILRKSDAAEFLNALTEIQETVHQFSADYKLRKGPVSVPSVSISDRATFDSS